MSNTQLGHAAFHPYAGTPEPLRTAANIPTLANGGLDQTKDNMRARIADLEREIAKLREEMNRALRRLKHIDPVWAVGAATRVLEAALKT